jgi:hypothetical protein
VFKLPVGPQLRVLQQEVLDRLLELGLESLELVDQLRGVLPRHEVGVGRGERLRVLRELVAGLLFDLLKDLAALVRVDQLLRAERGDRLALDLVRCQVEILRLVADPTGPVGRLDDEQAPELEQVDGLLAALCVLGVRADVQIATVTVGNPGNAGEWSGGTYDGQQVDRICGAVDYVYDIGKYEVTAGQYTEFLNAVARTDPYDLYFEGMWSNAWGCKIKRSGGWGNYSYSVSSYNANRPVNYVGWGDAARFCNWLHNGQPTGAQALDATEDGAYFLNGAKRDYELSNVMRESDASVAIPRPAWCDCRATW